METSMGEKALELILWLQECHSVKDWLLNKEDDAHLSDDKFKRWHNAYRQAHWGIIHTISELVNFKQK